MKPSVWILCLAVTLTLWHQAEGHGRLIDPPGRSTAWRYGFGTPANYNDNQLYCGGKEVQRKAGGKCGLCGDPYSQPQPRANENGGYFGNGIIVKKFKQGDVMNVSVQITAAHLGWFEFRLCPLENPADRVPATQECLDRNLLTHIDGATTRFPAGNMAQVHSFPLMLPPDVECEQCVLQWKYHTGNSWGVNPDGTSGMGQGHQEEFYGCADIAILPQSTQEEEPGEGDEVEGEVEGEVVDEEEEEEGEDENLEGTEEEDEDIVTDEDNGDDEEEEAQDVEDEEDQEDVEDEEDQEDVEDEEDQEDVEDEEDQEDVEDEDDQEDVGVESDTEQESDANQNQDGFEQIPNQQARYVIGAYCLATGDWTGQASMDDYCRRNCFHTPPYCPPECCACYVDSSDESDPPLTEEPQPPVPDIPQPPAIPEPGPTVMEDSPGQAEDGWKTPGDLDKPESSITPGPPQPSAFNTPGSPVTEESPGAVENDWVQPPDTDRPVLPEPDTAPDTAPQAPSNMPGSRRPMFTCGFQNNEDGDDDLDSLCRAVCDSSSGECFNKYCSCQPRVTSFEATGDFANVDGADIFCQLQCNLVGKCPWDLCQEAEQPEQLNCRLSESIQNPPASMLALCTTMCPLGDTYCPNFCHC